MVGTEAVAAFRGRAEKLQRQQQHYKASIGASVGLSVHSLHLCQLEIPSRKLQNFPILLLYTFLNTGKKKFPLTLLREKYPMDFNT